jgi:hypothetical protein
MDKAETQGSAQKTMLAENARREGCCAIKKDTVAK